MRRVILSATVLLAAMTFVVITAGASNGSSAGGNYTVELDNAFGLVTGADFKVAGVRAGTITSIDLDQTTLHARVGISVTQSGLGSFRSDVFCQSRPQSLIGEYFLECDPGHSAQVLKPGSVVPVTQTQTTIAPDLLNDVLRMPYRERLSLIINELGAGVAGRSGDLQAALQRAVPALTQTDNLLNLLANDSRTLQNLTLNSDAVITALANNSAQVQRFVTEANNTATAAASRRTALQATFHKLPAFLEQLRPTLAQLGAAADANTPVLANLNASSSQLSRLLTDLVPFSGSTRIALRSLGQASVTGSQAVRAAGPTVAHLNQFAQVAPELSQNLAIVLHDLDDRSRAVETDVRSPGGKGYTGLEALLQYVFNQTLAINTYGPYGHMLAVDAFVDARCTPYATPGTIATNLKLFGAASYRQCYSWLGPRQPGVNVTDPTNPKAAVPDPGGSPPGLPGPATTAAKLAAAATSKTAAGSAIPSTTGAGALSSPLAGPTTGALPATKAPATNAPATNVPATGVPVPSAAPTAAPPISLKKTLGQILGLLGLGNGSSGSAAASSPPSSAQDAGNAQQLLNYLLAP